MGILKTCLVWVANKAAETFSRPPREELEEKLEQVRLNQREMDSALDMWRERVADYQEAANLRARQRAQEALEFKKRIAQHERLLRQAEHQRNMHRCGPATCEFPAGFGNSAPAACSKICRLAAFATATPSSWGMGSQSGFLRT